MAQLNDLKTFEDIVSPWLSAYRCAVITYLAINHDEQWHLRYALIALTREVPPNLSDSHIKTDHVIGGREIQRLDTSDSIKLFTRLKDDPLSVHIGELNLSLAPASAALPRFYIHPLHHPLFPGSQRWPSITVTPTDCIREMMIPRELIDLELQSHSTPYDGLSDLMSEFRIPTDILSTARIPGIEWLATAPARIDLSQTVLSEGKMSIVVDAARHLDESKIEIGVREHQRASSTLRYSVPQSKIQWSNDNRENFLGIANVDSPNAVIATLFLKYDGELLEKVSIRDQHHILSDRLAVLRHFSQTENLEEIFISDRQDEFEDAVSLLFELSGLVTFKFGGIGKIKDAPDLLAVSSHQHFFVIECTVADPRRRGKLFKLYERTKQFREFLEKSEIPFIDVIGVIVTQLPREDTTSSWGDCENYKISLVARENIENLIGRLEFPPSANELFEAALSCIPSSGSSEPTLFE